MRIVEEKTYDEERAFYGSHGLKAVNCRIDGPADGESAFKECTDIAAERCYFNLRYPFWHVHGLNITNCELTPLCRAALWYSDQIVINNTKLYGIKALRECSDAALERCDIISPEFGWSSRGVRMEDCTAQSEYFMLRAASLNFRGVQMKGKYSFQYIENAVFENCTFDTKDAFWHGKDVTVKNSLIKGEYLAWYSENLTLDHCRIIGTQPLCYCRGLKLIDCEMEQTDLAFEKSEVNATITTPVDSVKNPRSGVIRLPAVGGIIMDDPQAEGQIIIGAGM